MAGSAPAAVRLAVEPLQIVGEFTVMIGNAFTVTVVDALPGVAHPVRNPTTEYDDVTAGLTIIVAPVAPVFQVNVSAPVAVSTADWPAQITGALMLIFGAVDTVTLDIAVFVHPFASVPVTV